MTDMIERVARAIVAAGQERERERVLAWPYFVPGTFYSTPWDELEPKVREEYLAVAHDAIEAMKLIDPAEGVPGGIAFEHAFFGEQTTVFHAFRDAWNTTLDAALAPPSESPPT